MDVVVKRVHSTVLQKEPKYVLSSIRNPPVPTCCRCRCNQMPMVTVTTLVRCHKLSKVAFAAHNEPGVADHSNIGYAHIQ